MFTIGTCSYCWAARRFFREAGIAVADHDLLTEEFTADNRAARIRTALRERTGSRTLPQVFVSGQHVGGAEDLFEAFDSGRLTALLHAAGITLDEDATLLRARDFLPNRPIAP
jgi:glutaredoxin